MPDTKISALTAAAAVNNADVTVIVQAGVDLKATKALMLTGGAGEDVILKASTLKAAKVENSATAPVGAYLQINENGTILLNSNSQDVQIVGGSSIFHIAASQDMDMSNVNPGKKYTIGCPTRTRVVCDDNTQTFTIVCAGACLYPYIPGAPANWLLPAPTDVWAALDRIAAAIVARTVGGPI